jgi:hypothetical protein
MKTKTKTKNRKPQGSPEMQAAMREFGSIDLNIDTTYIDRDGPLPMTAAEAWIDDIANPTEPNSQERFDTVNRRARGVREALAAMTPEQYADWTSDYYLGIMVPPFGLDNDDGKGHDNYHLVPYGMSTVIDLPKLHPDDL